MTIIKRKITQKFDESNENKEVCFIYENDYEYSYLLRQNAMESNKLPTREKIKVP
jgi:hypothetical protein